MWYIIPHTKTKIIAHVHAAHGHTRRQFFGMYQLETRFARITLRHRLVSLKNVRVLAPRILFNIELRRQCRLQAYRPVQAPNGAPRSAKHERRNVILWVRGYRTTEILSIVLVTLRDERSDETPTWTFRRFNETINTMKLNINDHIVLIGLVHKSHTRYEYYKWSIE